MTIITTTSEDLARAYFGCSMTGLKSVRDLGITSRGRPIRAIRIDRGTRAVTLIGAVITARGPCRWEERYPRDRVEIDD